MKHLSVIEQAKAIRVDMSNASKVLTDKEAVNSKSLYEPWKLNVTYDIGERVNYNGDLFKCQQRHTSQENWKPDIASASLWTKIDEVHAGTKEDPILYSTNMVLEEGKFYKEKNIIYRCTRNSGNPVYNELSALVGIYVEIV